MKKYPYSMEKKKNEKEKPYLNGNVKIQSFKMILN